MKKNLLWALPKYKNCLTDLLKSDKVDLYLKGRKNFMKHIKTLVEGKLNSKHGGCGECATGCQSACKTSNPMIYQKCEAKATVKGERVNRVN